MQTTSTIRLARASDEAELIALIRMMWQESGWRPLDIDSVRATLARAFDRKGGIIAVIGVPGHIRAMLYVQIANAWYTRENHLEELFCWVHPDHRKSDYANQLIEHAKKYSDDISASMGQKVPLIMGVLTNKRMAAKVHLYRRRFGAPAGAFFVHNASWIDKSDLCEDDFWRVPSIAKKMFRRQERNRSERHGTRAVNGSARG